MSQTKLDECAHELATQFAEELIRSLGRCIEINEYALSHASLADESMLETAARFLAGKRALDILVDIPEEDDCDLAMIVRFRD